MIEKHAGYRNVMDVRNFHGIAGLVGGFILAGLLLAGCKTGKSEQTFGEVVTGTSQAAVGGVDVSGSTSATTSTPVPSPSATKASTVMPNNGPAPAGGSAEFLRMGESLIIIFSDLPNPVPPFEER